MPHRGRSRVAAVPDAGDDAAPDHGLHVVGGGLHDDAAGHDDGEEQEHAAAAELLAHEQSEERAPEAAQVVAGRDPALHLGRRVVEVLQEVLPHDDAAEDALLVPEEHHRRARRDRYPPVQGLRRLEEPAPAIAGTTTPVERAYVAFHLTATELVV